MLESKIAMQKKPRSTFKGNKLNILQQNCCDITKAW